MENVFYKCLNFNWYDKSSPVINIWPRYVIVYCSTKFATACKHIDMHIFTASITQLFSEPVAWEVLLSRGAEICVVIATSGGQSPPNPPPCYRNIHHAYHALYFSKSHLKTT